MNFFIFQHFSVKKHLINTILHYPIIDFCPDRTVIDRKLLINGHQYDKTPSVLR